MDYKEILTKVEEGCVSLPCTATNDLGQVVVINSGTNDDGDKYFKLQTCQDNGWLRVNVYYENGDSEEYFEH